MNVTVYLGAYPGNDAKYSDAAYAFGKWLGEKGHNLVYGGSRSGLMGVLADSVLANGGTVTGIELRFFYDQGIHHDALTVFELTDTMQERKRRMLELGDIYIAFPGGTGTLEEISEAITRLRLGTSEKACVFFNLDGYYDLLRAQLEVMKKEGFLTAESVERVYFADTLSDIEALIGG